MHSLSRRRVQGDQQAGVPGQSMIALETSRLHPSKDQLSELSSEEAEFSQWFSEGQGISQVSSSVEILRAEAKSFARA